MPPVRLAFLRRHPILESVFGEEIVFRKWRGPGKVERMGGWW